MCSQQRPLQVWIHGEGVAKDLPLVGIEPPDNGGPVPILDGVCDAPFLLQGKVSKPHPSEKSVVQTVGHSRNEARFAISPCTQRV